MNLKTTLITLIAALAASLSAQEISVRGGNGLDLFIASGDTSPRSADGTDFGSTNVTGGAIERTFRIRNLQPSDGFPFTGDLTVLITENSSHFSITAAPLFPIAEDSFADFTIRYDPTSTGTHTATISIANNDPDGNENPYTFRVTGAGVGVPEISVFGSPNLLGDGDPISDGQTTTSTSEGTNFGTVDALGIDVSKTFRIRNTGTGTLTLSYSDNSNEFTASGLSSSIAPGSFDDFTITFNPRQSGTRTATVSLTTNDSNENPFTFALRGLAQAPEIQVRNEGDTLNINDGDTTPNTVDGTDFGSVLVTAGAVERVFRIENQGSSSGLLFATGLTVDISDSSSQFTVLDDPLFAIPPGGFHEFRILFNPSVPGTHDATITLTHNDPDGDENPYTFRVTGVGVGSPEIQVFGSPNLISDGDPIIDGQTSVDQSEGTDFGTVDALALIDATRTFRIRNTGSAPLTIGYSDDSDEFTASGVAPTISPGSFDDFTITFNPQQSGTRTATVSLNTNDSNEDPFTFTLRGFAQAPEIQVRDEGDTLSINDGDSIPSSADGTDFGSRDLAELPRDHVFRIENQGSSSGLLLPATPLTVTLSEDSPHFSIVSAPPLPIPAGGFAEFTVRYHPTSTGLHEATITLRHNDPDGGEDPYNFSVQGEATGESEIAVFVNPLLLLDGEALSNNAATSSLTGTDFGIVDALFPIDKFITFRVKNLGSIPLTTGPISVSGDRNHFDISEPLSSSIPAGGFDDFTITFDPVASGQLSATLSIPNNDPDGNEDPFLINLTGFARAPEIEVAGGQLFEHVIRHGDLTPRPEDNTDFGTTNVTGGAIENTFRILNLEEPDGVPGSGTLTVLSVTVDDPNFSVAFPPLPVFPLVIDEQAVGEIRLRFDPLTPGTHTANVTIVHNDPDGFESPYTFQIRGVADEPILSVFGGRGGSIELLDDAPARGESGTIFPVVEFSDAPGAPLTFTIRNAGLDDLLCSYTPTIPEFRVDTRTTRVLPGESEAFEVSFEPTRPGEYEGSIAIISNDIDQSPFFINLRAESTAPAIEVFGGASLDLPLGNGATATSPETGTDLGELEQNAEAVTRSFLVKNSGNSDLAITSIACDHPAFPISSPPGTLAPDGGGKFNLTFSPEEIGEQLATVTLVTNDPLSSPFTFTVKGEVLPPQLTHQKLIQSFSFSNEQKELIFRPQTGKTYCVTTSVDGQVWLEVDGLTGLSGEEDIQVDLSGFQPSPESPTRFFRVEEE
ncbi:MAG: choice-of-anchor D domain-containing protein [Verrucomicrobiota bacterium JB023]|nr:choice-of-anchor D domain-containing protein [Verrucomicrobiota bacterium JB023]